MCLNKLIYKISNKIKLQIKNIATCTITCIYISFKKVQIYACIILFVLLVRFIFILHKLLSRFHKLIFLVMIIFILIVSLNYRSEILKNVIIQISKYCMRKCKLPVSFCQLQSMLLEGGTRIWYKFAKFKHAWDYG